MKIFINERKNNETDTGNFSWNEIFCCLLHPIVCFLFSWSNMATSLFMLILMKKLNSRSRNTILRFQDFYPNEAIQYNKPAKMICNSTVIVTLMITQNYV